MNVDLYDIKENITLQGHYDHDMRNLFFHKNMWTTREWWLYSISIFCQGSIALKAFLFAITIKIIVRFLGLACMNCDSLILTLLLSCEPGIPNPKEKCAYFWYSQYRLSPSAGIQFLYALSCLSCCYRTLQMHQFIKNFLSKEGMLMSSESEMLWPILSSLKTGCLSAMKCSLSLSFNMMANIW